MLDGDPGVGVGVRYDLSDQLGQPVSHWLAYHTRWGRFIGTGRSSEFHNMPWTKGVSFFLFKLGIEQPRDLDLVGKSSTPGLQSQPSSSLDCFPWSEYFCAIVV